MPLVYGSPEHWIARADDARHAADRIDDADAKTAMMEIARNYEKIAGRAKVRESERNASVDLDKKQSA